MVDAQSRNIDLNLDDSHYITLDAVDYTDTTIPQPPNSFVAQLLNPDGIPT